MSNALSSPAFLFDLDGTLVDSVYQHVLAWREALERAGIALAVWRIHRRIGMSGGLLVNALLRETGKAVTREETERIRQFHAEASLERPDLLAQAGLRHAQARRGAAEVELLGHRDEVPDQSQLGQIHKRRFSIAKNNLFA